MISINLTELSGIDTFEQCRVAWKHKIDSSTGCGPWLPIKDKQKLEGYILELLFDEPEVAYWLEFKTLELVLNVSN